MCRMEAFSPAWQAAHGISDGERIVCVDLDSIVVGSLDSLFDRDDPFVILQGIHTTNPCPYNGALWILRAGYRPDIANFGNWQGDDQEWLAHSIHAAPSFGPKNGVYGYQKPGWKTDRKLPSNACMVTFVAKDDPSRHLDIDWVRDNWK